MTRQEDPGVELIWGVHPVMELLQHGARRVERVLVAEGRRAGLGRLLRAAREAGVPVSHVPQRVLAKELGRGARHQGVAARVAPRSYDDPDELCRRVVDRTDGLLLLLDRVSDPRNLGAVLRSAAAAGATGVLLAGGTVGMTGVVVKASAGAAERLQIAREPHPVRRIQQLAAAGFSAIALDPGGETGWDEVELTGRIIVVAGGEGSGVRRGILDQCDRRVAIPTGPVESLNISVATSVLLFEAVRQRRAAPRGA